MGSTSQPQRLEPNDEADDRADPNPNVAGIPPGGVIRLWQDVATGIDRSQTGTISSSCSGLARPQAINAILGNAHRAWTLFSTLPIFENC